MVALATPCSQAGPKVIKCLTQLSMKSQLLVNTKMLKNKNFSYLNELGPGWPVRNGVSTPLGLLLFQIANLVSRS